MTVREVYDYLLSELNKVEAPSLLLESFNYYFGKAIDQTCNLWYSLYEETQLLTDNLLPLTRTITLQRADISGKNVYSLPSDYWHILPTCVVNFTSVSSTNPCTGSNTPLTLQVPAIKLNSQLNSGILKDYYTKPSYNRPYIYIHKYINLVPDPDDNTKTIRTEYDLEIKSGDDSIYTPSSITIDYLKFPKIPNFNIKNDQETLEESSNQRIDNYIRNLYLTQKELDNPTDISTIMEFPDNFCYEIINKLTALVLEHNGDPRLGNNIPMNQTMNPPRQA